MKTLITNRLILRSFENSDLEEFYAYAKNPDVGPNAGWKPHDNIEESRGILENFIKEDKTYAITLKETSTLIGSIGIEYDAFRKDIEGCRELGYVLAKDFWGHGYMTEGAGAVIQYVFEEMQLELFSVKHYTDNLRSKRVIEKLGFTFEGVLKRAAKIYNGEIKDMSCYSMTQKEYFCKIVK